MKRRPTPLALLLCLPLVAPPATADAEPGPASALPSVGSDALAATVAGIPITVGQVDSLAKAKSHDGKVDPNARRLALRDLVRITALSTLPDSAREVARPEVAFLRRVAGLSVLADALVRDGVEGAKPDEAALRREYEAYLASLAGKSSVDLIEVIVPDGPKEGDVAASLAADAGAGRPAVLRQVATRLGLKVTDLAQTDEARLMPDVRASLAGLPVGAQFGPVRTAFGTVFGVLVGRGPTRPTPYEAMRPTLESRISARAPGLFVSKVISQSHVDILDKDFLPPLSTRSAKPPETVPSAETPPLHASATPAVPPSRAPTRQPSPVGEPTSGTTTPQAPTGPTRLAPVGEPTRP